MSKSTATFKLAGDSLAHVDAAVQEFGFADRQAFVSKAATVYAWLLRRTKTRKPLMLTHEDLCEIVLPASEKPRGEQP